MAAEVVQTKYEELDAIARRFAQQAQTNRALQQQVQRGVDALRNGGWEGRGARFLWRNGAARFPGDGAIDQCLGRSTGHDAGDQSDRPAGRGRGG